MHISVISCIFVSRQVFVLDQSSQPSLEALSYRHPSLSSISPAAVSTVDTTVSISGSNFGPTAAQVSVVVNGVASAAVDLVVSQTSGSVFCFPLLHEHLLCHSL